MASMKTHQPLLFTLSRALLPFALVLPSTSHALTWEDFEYDNFSKRLTPYVADMVINRTDLLMKLGLSSREAADLVLAASNDAFESQIFLVATGREQNWSLPVLSKAQRVRALATTVQDLAIGEASDFFSGLARDLTFRASGNDLAADILGGLVAWLPQFGASAIKVDGVPAALIVDQLANTVVLTIRAGNAYIAFHDDLTGVEDSIRALQAVTDQLNAYFKTRRTMRLTKLELRQFLARLPISPGTESADLSNEASGPALLGGTAGSGKLTNLRPNRVWLRRESGDKNVHVANFQISERIKMRLQAIAENANASADIKIGFYLSEGKKMDSSPKLVGTDEIKKSNLKKNDTHTEEEGLSLEYPGWYNIVGCVDISKRVPEINESDNCSSPVPFQVGSRPDLALLEIGLQTTAGVPVPAPLVGKQFNIALRASNLGENFGRTVRIAYFVSGGPFGDVPTLLGWDRIRRENLKSGNSKLETLTSGIMFTQPGTYKVSAMIDPDHYIPDINRNNNGISIDVTVTAPE